MITKIKNVVLTGSSRKKDDNHKEVYKNEKSRWRHIRYYPKFAGYNGKLIQLFDIITDYKGFNTGFRNPINTQSTITLLHPAFGEREDRKGELYNSILPMERITRPFGHKWKLIKNGHILTIN